MKRLTTLCAVAASALALVGCGRPTTPTDVERALSYGRLAPIPTNATAFQIAHDGAYFGAYFLRFTAPSNTIAQWFEDSAGLRGVAPIKLGPTYVWTPFAGDSSQEKSRLDVPYVAGRKFTPEWWHPDLTSTGELYQIPGKQGHGAGGPLVVDQRSHTVFLYTRW